MELSKDHVSTVAAQDLWGRHVWEAPGFVRVTEYELARLYRTLMRVRPRDPGRFYGGLADPVLEPERSAARRELVAVLAPDRLHSG